MEAVRWQRQHARKCSGAHSNHQQQAQAKATYGRGQNKRADAECSTDLPDELLASSRATHAGNRNTVLHHWWRLKIAAPWKKEELSTKGTLAVPFYQLPT